MIQKIYFFVFLCLNGVEIPICTSTNTIEKKIIFRFFSQKNVENTVYKKIQYSCFFVFFFEKIHKIPICKVSEKILFFQNLSKNDVQNPDIYDFEFLFSKNVISRYYRNYQHFFSSWHYAWGKMIFFCIFSFIFTMVDKLKFHFFQSFLPYFRVTPPPIVLLRKRQKVSKMYLWVFRQKLKNRSLHGENDFFNIFEKNVPMRILTEISKNLPVV